MNNIESQAIRNLWALARQENQHKLMHACFPEGAVTDKTPTTADVESWIVASKGKESPIAYAFGCFRDWRMAKERGYELPKPEMVPNHPPLRNTSLVGKPREQERLDTPEEKAAYRARTDEILERINTPKRPQRIVR